MPLYRIETLGTQHERKNFDSGIAALDRYFREQVSQDVRRRATSCYVMCETATDAVAGFYTIAAGSVLLTDIPESLQKRLPRYPLVPVARVGRLAIDKTHQGKQLGAALLFDAARRAKQSDIAVVALTVDPKDEIAASFYLHHGFVRFGRQPLQLMLFLANANLLGG